MQAQVRTIVAASGERLVVMPEAQYAALVSAAARPPADQAGAAGRSGAASPVRMMAQTPAAAAAPRP
ncbi:hypothetical protein ACFOEX_08655, partial [Camelimonas abortus]